jgi:hypothetical protein
VKTARRRANWSPGHTSWTAFLGTNSDESAGLGHAARRAESWEWPTGTSSAGRSFRDVSPPRLRRRGAADRTHLLWDSFVDPSKLRDTTDHTAPITVTPTNNQGMTSSDVMTT